MSAAAATPIDRATKLALVATGLAIFVVANDFTALAVALPAIERDFHVDVSTVQWTINACALLFGVFTVTGGRLADLLGRRRIFITGAGIGNAAGPLLGGGILYMFQVAGGSIGLGIATTIVSTAAVRQAQPGGSAGAAFTDGLQTTLRVSGVLALAGLFVASVFVGRGTPREPSTPRISEATTGGIT